MSLHEVEKGFAAVEALLIVVILAIIGGTGYYVWHAKQNTDKTNNAAAKVAQSSPEAHKASVKSAGTTFKIKELGVQFQLPASLKGLSYSIQQVTEDRGPTTSASLMDSRLIDLLNKCDVANGDTNTSSEPSPFAAIEKMPGTYEDGEAVEAQLLKQFKDFNINIAFPNGALCTDKDETLNNQWRQALAADQKAFIDAFKATATPIQ